MRSVVRRVSPVVLAAGLLFGMGQVSASSKGEAQAAQPIECVQASGLVFVARNQFIGVTVLNRTDRAQRTSVTVRRANGKVTLGSTWSRVPPGRGVSDVSTLTPFGIQPGYFSMVMYSEIVGGGSCRDLIPTFALMDRRKGKVKLLITDFRRVDPIG